MNSLLKHFLRDEAGATAIEYGLIAALISVAIFVSLRATGVTIHTLFQNIVDVFPSV